MAYSWEFGTVDVEFVDIMTCMELVSYLMKLNFPKEDMMELESKLCNAMPVKLVS